jgi:uncharacterized membrane protein YbhN (UPF0104 family)
MGSTQGTNAQVSTGRDRRWRGVLLVVIAAGGIGLLGVVARSTLTKSVSALGHIQWAWIPLAVFCEFASMAAVARSQRRLLRAGGTKLHLGSVMAVAHAGNAISASQASTPSPASSSTG